MGLMKQMHRASLNRPAIRRWLFELCQSRSGQCLRRPPECRENPARDPE